MVGTIRSRVKEGMRKILLRPGLTYWRHDKAINRPLPLSEAKARAKALMKKGLDVRLVQDSPSGGYYVMKSVADGRPKTIVETLATKKSTFRSKRNRR